MPRLALAVACLPLGALALSGCLADLAAGFHDCGDQYVPASDAPPVAPGERNVTVHARNDAEGTAVVCVTLGDGPPVEFRLCGSDGHNGCGGTITAPLNGTTITVDARELVRDYHVNATLEVTSGDHVLVAVTGPTHARAMRIAASDAPFPTD